MLKKYIVLIKHPLSSELENITHQMEVTLESLNIFCKKYNFKVLGIYPNTDPGSYDILNVIDKFKNNNSFLFIKNLPHLEFVNIIRNTATLVGNSSMGILEAPFYKLPVVNIGNRQQGRLNAGNVEFVNHNKNNILSALKKACFDQKYIKKIKSLDNPYGNGDASKKISDIIDKIDLSNKKWYVKRKLC